MSESRTSLSPHKDSNVASAHDASSDRREVNASMNEQSTRQNAELRKPLITSSTAAIFQSNTVAPSSPPNISTPPRKPSTVFKLDTSSHLHASLSTPSGHSTPSSAGLRIHTDIPGYTVTAASAINTARSSGDFSHAAPKTIGIARTPSIKNILASSVGSNSNLGSAPSSVVSSPMLNALPDVTPLPSPLMSGDSPGPWKKLTRRPTSQEVIVTADSALVTANGESISSAIANQSKRRAYHGLGINESGLASTAINREKEVEGHTRNRSISEYVPEAVQVPKTRHITVSGSQAPVQALDPMLETATSMDMHLRREPHLALQRGLGPIPRPPTPPSSRAGGENSDSDSSLTAPDGRVRKLQNEYYDAHSRDDKKKKRWRALKILGEGTFSKVMLATSQLTEDNQSPVTGEVFGEQMEGVLTPVPEAKMDRKKLVAVKICEHGPKGGASEERVEMSLKRELEIMKTLHHPSLVHLKAWNIELTRAILVLSYCPGGDLFEVASQHRALLVPGLIRRIFAELIGAVQYLHGAHIVHRDIKLENVLVNLPAYELARDQDWTLYPFSVITLTDLGLSRHVADDEKLTTRCGSDDYAAPEVILGQPYDGRAIDAWSLGVLLYALLESRLPFDKMEERRMRSHTSHRIARVEWIWVVYNGEEGDHEADPEKFKAQGLLGAMVATEALLRRARNRWTLEQVAELEWVKDGIAVEGGIKFREEDQPEEVLDIDSSPL